MKPKPTHGGPRPNSGPKLKDGRKVNKRKAYYLYEDQVGKFTGEELRAIVDHYLNPFQNPKP